MAKSNQGKDDKTMSMPDRFKKAVWDIDGWYNPDLAKENGQALIGKIVQTRVIKARGRNTVLHLCQLEEPMLAILAKDEEPIELVKGDVIGILERAKLEVLREVSESNATVYIMPEKKINLKDGNTMWVFEIGIDGKKRDKPVNPRDLITSDSDKDDADDIPF